jgi:hypothetical protein
MTRVRPRLPHWTSHPGFGLAVLLALAVTLIVRGEPQPSSRPSGTSVGVSGSPTAPASVPSLLVIRAGIVEARQPHNVRRVPLPGGARPLSVVTGRGMSVVLAALDGHQRAYAVQRTLEVRDLGPADAAIAAAAGPAAVLIETSLIEPGELTSSTVASPTATARPSASRRASASPSETALPDLRNFAVRRYDAAAQPVGSAQVLPAGTRMATDTAVGLVVWEPVNRVYDNGVALEPLSAAATLIRPDNSLRELGPVHPLTADATDLLVWDVARRRFGLMPLRWATSSLTSTASPSSSSGPSSSGPSSSGPSSSSPSSSSPAPSSPSSSSPAPSSPAESSGSPTRKRSASASASPSTVAGTRWFFPTRGISVVTGPASFAPDGSAFAVYAQVGSRRRLVVAELQNLGTDKVEVLALVQPTVPSQSASSGRSPASGGSGPVITVSGSNSAGVSGSPSRFKTASPSASPSVAVVQPDGFPIQAPLAPLWWKDQVVALGTDATVVGYRPGSRQAALLDLGPKDLQAVAQMP